MDEVKLVSQEKFHIGGNWCNWSRKLPRSSVRQSDLNTWRETATNPSLLPHYFQYLAWTTIVRDWIHFAELYTLLVSFE